MGGCRLPHSWLRLNIRNNTVLMSSVHLHWLSALVSTSYPIYIVLVSDQNKALLRTSLYSNDDDDDDDDCDSELGYINQRKDNFLVVPFSLRETSQDGSCHTSLQDHFQKPRYNKTGVPSSDRNTDNNDTYAEDTDFQIV